MPSHVTPHRTARRTGRTAAIASLLLVLLTAPWAPARATSPEQDRIAETRAQLDAVRAELEDAREAAEEDEISLEEADRQVTAALDAVETAQQAVARQHQAVDDAEVELADAQAVLAAERQKMGERIGRLYRQQRPDPLLTVMGAGSMTDAVKQTSYMTAIGRQDRALVESLTNAQQEVEGRSEALAAEQVALEAVLVEQQELLVDVEELRNDREVIAAASAELVAELQSRENHLEEEAIALLRQRAASEAAAAAEELAEAVTADDEAEGEDDSAALAPAPVAAPAGGGGGGFSWPAGGTVTSGFGPRWGRNHNGIDIAAGTGSPIVAARGGTVTKAENWGGSGYGNVVIVAHSGGFATLYAHLNSISVSAGQSVGAGQQLGGMGCTGSCTGTHLHFEIWSGGTPVDPMGYL